MDPRLERGLMIAATARITRKGSHLRRPGAESSPAPTPSRMAPTRARHPRSTAPARTSSQRLSFPCKHVYRRRVRDAARDARTTAKGEAVVTETQAVRVTYGAGLGEPTTAATTDDGPSFCRLLTRPCASSHAAVSEPARWRPVVRAIHYWPTRSLARAFKALLDRQRTPAHDGRTPVKRAKRRASTPARRTTTRVFRVIEAGGRDADPARPHHGELRRPPQRKSSRTARSTRPASACRPARPRLLVDQVRARDGEAPRWR